MAVPYTFGTATAAIPLSQLDSNFATAITIGNTAVQLGNTVTTLNNMTLANVTISSGTITITNVAVTTANVSGTANISTLVVVGNETVGGNTTITGNITAANANVTSNLVLSGGTANSVAYLNTTKVLTTGSALTFDGSQLAVNAASGGINMLVSSSGNTGLRVVGGTGAGLGSYLSLQAQGSNAALIGTEAAIVGSGTSTNLMLFGYGSNSIIFAPATAEAMRLTSTSLYTASTIKVGIGTSTPTAGISLDKYGTAWNTSANTYPFPAGNVFLAMGATAATNNWFGFTGFYGNSSGSANILLQANVNNTSQQAGNFIGSLVTGAASADLQFGTMTAAATNAGNSVKNEQMRLDASGNLLVGKTATSDSTVGFQVSSGGRVACGMASGDAYVMYSTSASAYRFYVTNAGQINATSIVINAISDQRLKENVRDIDIGLDAIMALKPRRFDWKEGKGQDKKNAAGFIAQEFEDVFPECVSTSKAGADGIEYKNINHETLIPTLVKAIQELKAEFDAYKASHP